jgi:hypothetical protein
MDQSFGIHTICYAPGMAATVDSNFLPFDVSANPEVERREMAHMLSFWRQGHHQNYSVSGLLSPKFSEKTGLSGRAFIDFIRANPGHDVWFINPFPQYLYMSFNIWEQGEFFHPGLVKRASQIFSTAGMSIDLAAFPRGSAKTLLFSNFWAGTPKFWDRFMADVDTLTRTADSMPEMLELAPYHLDAPAPYYPFFFERYFTTFLIRNPDIKSCSWAYSFDETIRSCGTEIGYIFLRDWGPIIDRWDERGVYSPHQRQIFHGIEKFFGLILTWRHMKNQAQAELLGQSTLRA